jgi:hypothetical protein
MGGGPTAAATEREADGGRARPSPSKLLARMLAGNQVQQALFVAAKLGLPDLIEQGSRTSGELAEATGAHEGSIYRLLRALSAVGVVAEAGRDGFALTPLGALLRADAPGSLRPFALWSGEVTYRVFGGLEHAVRTGEPAFDHVFGTEFYAYLDDNPELGDLFADLMSWNTAPVAPALAAYDLSAVDLAVDLGGGRGELLAAILAAHPAIRGVLVEQPRMLEQARAALEAAGVAGRCKLVPGDVLAAVPEGGDVYLLKSVLHGMTDAEATRVLANCRAAGSDGTRVLVVELVIPPPGESSPAKLMDLLMLAGGRGRERTEDEFRGLFRSAGFELTNVVAVENGYSILEGS